MNVWNGQAFGCYHLKLVLTTKVVSSIEDVEKGEIPVRLTSQLVVLGSSTQAFVQGRQQGAADPEAHLSDSPSTRFDPFDGEFYASNPAARPTTFSMLLEDAAYAHEFGHVLGLDDSYEFGSFGSITLKADAEPDLMYRAERQLSPISVARAVRRSGLDDQRLRCHYRYFVPSSQIFPYTPGNEISIDLILCDFPPISGSWDAKGTDKRQRKFLGTISGGFNLGALGSASTGGPVSGVYRVNVLEHSSIHIEFEFPEGLLNQSAEWLGDIIAASIAPRLRQLTQSRG